MVEQIPQYDIFNSKEIFTCHRVWERNYLLAPRKLNQTKTEISAGYAAQ